MHRVQRLFLVVNLLIGATSGTASLALAAPGADFIVAGDDSYGVADCMKPGMECGRIIADAWCEAHGHGHASTFGFSDDVTGATKVSTGAAPRAPATPSVIIHCGE
jgi:hypothetical protein